GGRSDNRGSSAGDAGPQQHRKPRARRDQGSLELGNTRVDCAENWRPRAETRGDQGNQRGSPSGKNARRLERENLEQARDGIRDASAGRRNERQRSRGSRRRRDVLEARLNRNGAISEGVGRWRLKNNAPRLARI